MVVAAHPLVAGLSIGVVVVVQALKLEVGHHGVIVHGACMWVQYIFLPGNH